jgi:RNA polymerase sigma-70 factor, ECF subfamily
MRGSVAPRSYFVGTMRHGGARGSARAGRLLGQDAFDDAEAQARLLDDLEPDVLEVVQRVAQQVVAGRSDAPGIQPPLDRPDRAKVAPNVLEQHEPATGTEHAEGLPDRLPVVRDGAQRQGGDDGIDARIVQVERLGVTQPQIDRAVSGASSGERQHRRADVDPDQVHVARIVGEIAAGPDPDLQSVADRVRRDPPPAVTEQPALDPTAPLVRRRHPIPDRPDPGRLTRGIHHQCSIPDEPEGLDRHQVFERVSRGGSRIRPATDLPLVGRARQGDLPAFEELVRARMDAVYRLTYAILGDEADARDAAQDTFVTAWRKIRDVRDPERFDAWLQRVAVNAARQTYRARRRRGVREIAVSRMGGGVEAGDTGHMDPAARADALALDGALRTLSIEQREILVLHHLEGLSMDDLADRLSIPPGTVKSRLFTARKALQAALDREASR